MSDARIQKLLPLQQMRFDHVCHGFKAIVREVETLQGQTSALRAGLVGAEEMPIGDRLVHEKHDAWRTHKLIELNIVLAGKMAEREEAREICVKEFGRLQALKKLLARAEKA